MTRPLNDEVAGGIMPSYLPRLVAAGHLRPESLPHVEQVIAETGEAADLVLTKLGLIGEDDLCEQIAGIYKLSTLQEQDLPSRAIQSDALNPSFLEANRLLPVACQGDAIVVATVDPSQTEALEGIKFATGLNVLPIVSTDTLFRLGYEALYQHQNEEPTASTAQMTDVSDDVARLKDLASEEPVVRRLNEVLAQAANLTASDVHIEPHANNYLIRFRIDGILRDHGHLPKGMGKSIISRAKILANLDIAEQRLPQDGRFAFPLRGHHVDVRMSTIAGKLGEGMVLRLLDQSRLALTYDALGFDQEQVALFDRFLSHNNGLIVITGPTGSGKSTTLYTWLKQLATGDKKILTIEDPIEYDIDDVVQSQVNPKIGVSFATALRSMLRHDPDIIMVGEIRDAETAQIAAHAAMTGHLVLTTLHTNDAATAFARMRDLGVEPNLLNSILIGIVAQGLVRKLCPTCSGDEVEACPTCHGVGFKGRTVVAECVEFIPELQEAIAVTDDTIAVRKAFRSSGVVDKLNAGLKLAASGVTTDEEVRRVLG